MNTVDHDIPAPELSESAREPGLLTLQGKSPRLHVVPGTRDTVDRIRKLASQLDIGNGENRELDALVKRILSTNSASAFEVTRINSMLDAMIEKGNIVAYRIEEISDNSREALGSHQGDEGPWGQVFEADAFEPDVSGSRYA